MVKEGKLTDGYLRAINNGDRLLQEKKQYLQKRLFYIKSRDPFLSKMGGHFENLVSYTC